MNKRAVRSPDGVNKSLNSNQKIKNSGVRRQPVQSRSQATVAALHQALAQVVDQAGEAGLTTQAIADRAGVSIGTFYQYFADREALLAHWLHTERVQVDRALTADLSAAVHAGHPLPQAVDQAMALLLSRLGGDTPGRQTLLRLAWLADAHHALAPALQHAAERNAALWSQQADAQAQPQPDAVAMYVAIRAVMGVIRAASLEQSPWLGTPALRQHLVTVVLALLQPGGAASVVGQGGDQVDGLGLPRTGAQGQAA
ncbi:TetR/AcrR family transcriptional regulator [Hydrogenophaga soli]